MDINKEDIFSQITTDYRTDTLKEVVKSQLANQKTKFNEEPFELLNELLKVITVEAALRASKVANSENKTTVSLEHVEKILAQIMLDFP